MNHTFFLITSISSISAKVALLGAIVWLQLYFLRRGPAKLRNALCAVSLIAIVLLVAAEVLVPGWLVKGPAILVSMDAASQTAASSAARVTFSWLTLVWIAGFAVMLARAIAGRAALSSLRRRSTLRERVEGIEVRMADVQIPLLCGVLRPAILVPRAASEWTDEQRRMVLAHELTHFRLGDHWTNLLAQVVRTALWFHPVGWWLAARLSREQELTCDEAVVGSGIAAQDYAAFLLESVRTLRSREMFCCAMAGSGASSLKYRFANLLDARRRPLTRPMAASLAFFVVAALGVMAVGPLWSQVYKAGGDVTPPKVLHQSRSRIHAGSQRREDFGPGVSDHYGDRGRQGR